MCRRMRAFTARPLQKKNNRDVAAASVISRTMWHIRFAHNYQAHSDRGKGKYTGLLRSLKTRWMPQAKCACRMFLFYHPRFLSVTGMSKYLFEGVWTRHTGRFRRILSPRVLSYSILFHYCSRHSFLHRKRTSAGWPLISFSCVSVRDVRSAPERRVAPRSRRRAVC